VQLMTTVPERKFIMLEEVLDILHVTKSHFKQATANKGAGGKWPRVASAKKWVFFTTLVSL
jgi:hypothetical protein